MLTSFWEENPSEYYARKLKGLVGDYSVTVEILDVNRASILKLVNKLGQSRIRSQPYHLIIMMGVSGSSHQFHVEVLAKPILAEPNQAEGDGEANGFTSEYTLMTTINLADNAMTPHNPTQLSFDAGNYFCNELYYRVLSLIYSKKIQNATKTGLLPAVFIHVPPPDHVDFALGLLQLQALVHNVIKSCI